MAVDEKKETLRQKFFQESFELGQKPRHGMFSIPISTAIGDDTYFKPKGARVDSEGAVITDPRNFTTKNVKKGKIDSVLFSPPIYISTGDPFKEAASVPQRNFVKEGYKLGGHDRNFRPAKTIQRAVKADFAHMTDHKEVSKNRKGPDGGVITEPRNFLTNPPKKGLVGKGTLLGPNPPHMDDPFERKRQLEREEYKAHLEKLQEKPFSQKVRGRETFATIKEAFGEDREYPQRKPPQARTPLMTHEAPFKPSNPSKKGYNKTLDRFPPYVEDPLKFAARKKEEDESKGKWKPSHSGKTITTPSITTNFRNLKNEFPSVLRRL